MIKVVGYREVSFTDAKTGRKIDGTTIYIVHDENSHVEGMMADKFFMSFRVSNDSNYIPVVGDVIKLYYNKYGKVSSVQRIESKK